jgi:2',3'-cyclic-nucleotide 2'-phosphodiesterase (5'-nucleotidase family)
LNNGGIRSIIPKGNVTARTAYEVMPFENSTVVLAISGKVVLEIVDYIISEKKPHPLSGMSFTINSDGKPSNIKIGNNNLEEEKVYYVVTSDYLANGGDNMLFLKRIARNLIWTIN